MTAAKEKEYLQEIEGLKNDLSITESRLNLAQQRNKLTDYINDNFDLSQYDDKMKRRVMTEQAIINVERNFIVNDDLTIKGLNGTHAQSTDGTMIFKTVYHAIDEQMEILNFPKLQQQKAVVEKSGGEAPSNPADAMERRLREKGYIN